MDFGVSSPFLGSAHCSFKISRPDSVFVGRPLAETNEVKHHVFGISYHASTFTIIFNHGGKPNNLYIYTRFEDGLYMFILYTSL